MKHIYVCSMSRSGGTLLYQMLKLLVEMRDIGLGCGFPMDMKYDFEDYHEFAVFKTERYFERFAEPVKSRVALAVGTWRDPRDVAASLLRFFTSREKFRSCKTDDDGEFVTDPEEIEIDVEQVWTNDALPALQDALDWFVSWEALDPYLSSYEALHPNYWPTFLRGIGIQMNIDVTPKEADWIFSALTLAKNMKRQQEMKQWISPSTLLTKEHITSNRGKKGTYRKWLDDDKLAQVKEIAGDFMSTHGYRWTK